ncbi:hypothetical protein OG216_21395 [Streptomycetaceae bacterium NBC_01309]
MQRGSRLPAGFGGLLVVGGFDDAGLLVLGLVLVGGFLEVADVEGFAEVGGLLLGAVVLGTADGEVLGAALVVSGADGVEDAGADEEGAADVLVPGLPFASLLFEDDPDSHAEAANTTATAAATTDMRVFFNSFQPFCAQHD